MSVFHLKYRPQKLADLDLHEVGETLTKILESKERPQCFLFSGPKGAGKTSAARIVTKAINCLKPKGVEPCGECENCRAILGNSSLDVVEIDAASNRGIEDIRLLKEKAYLLPTKLKYKVFIIDEVHMLTKEAFNALLKLIEEPPKNTIFILCTTDPQKIPETVVSRLIKVDFKKGSKKQLKGSLKRIIESEKIDIEEGAIDWLVGKSDGSFRNLHKTFNELCLEYGDKISKKQVEEFYGRRAGDVSEEEFEADLASGEIKTILEKLERMAEAGVDFAAFREKLIYYFQRKLLSFYGAGEDEEKSKLSIREVTVWLNYLIVAGKSEKDVLISQLPLELAVVDFLGGNSGERADGGGSRKSEKKEEKVAEKNEAGDKEKKAKQVSEEKEELREEEFKIDEEPKSELIEERVISNIALEEIEKGWGKLLMAVKPFNHSVEAFLRSTRPKEVSNNVLTVEVFYPFHKERLEENRNRRIVEEGIKSIYGVELRFECILGKDKREPLVIGNDTPVAEVSPTLAAEGENKTETKDIYDVAKDIFG